MINKLENGILLNNKEIDVLFKNFDDFLENKSKFKDIVFYGSGSNCIRCLELFRKEGRTLPKVICVSKLNENDEQIEGIPVISFEDVLEKYTDHYILVTSVLYAKEIISNNLKNYNKEKILFKGAYGSEDLSGLKDFIIKNQKKLLEIRSSLIDKKSKEMFMQILFSKATNDLDIYEKYYTPNQYFQEDILFLGENETFLDIGAFTGDTAKSFIEYCNGKYNKIICCEPDKENYKYIEELQKSNPKIQLIKKGISNKAETLKLKTDSSSSVFIEEENTNEDYVSIELDSIDNLIKEEVTFIKMDIEGFEMNALHGAVNTIKKYRPKLAICIYHKYTDFIDIPKFINNLDLGYKFYVRHHEKSNFCETVLYAIPN